jgi:antitoxin FitA
MWPGRGGAYCALPRFYSEGKSGFATALDPGFSRDIIDLNDLMEAIMAGNLHVRNLDDELIAKLKRRAARHGRSTEAEHREILRQALAAEIEPSFDTLAAELRKLTKRRKQTPSEVLLREGRDER